MHAAFTSLRQSSLHDVARDAVDLDVHLQRGHTSLGSGHLEVHVAQMIFITEDIGQHRETIAFLDQAHGDAGHMRLEWHTGIQHRQTAAAYRCHRAGTVGFGNFRHHAYRVTKIFFVRQHRYQRALCQTAMADFAALG